MIKCRNFKTKQEAINCEKRLNRLGHYYTWIERGFDFGWMVCWEV